MRERTVPSEMETLGAVAQRPSLDGALDAARELLGMDIAFASRFEDSEQVFARVRGDGDGFGVREGGRVPLRESYCHHILAERMDPMVPDMRDDEVGATMAATAHADVRAYASVPLVRSDGRIYGTLCCASHEARPLDRRDERFLRVLARIVCGELERDEHEARGDRLRVESASVLALVAAMEARDRYTGDHARAVVAHASRVARGLGLDTDERFAAERVALLHDIGKIAVPDAILHHPGPLDDAQWAVMRTHSTISERIVASIPELARLAPAVRAEHERWDGGGYPDGLEGEAIPVYSRIAFVCDAYHAMTSDRPYRARMSSAAARAELRRCAGTQFDPRVVDALLVTLRSL